LGDDAPARHPSLMELAAIIACKLEDIAAKLGVDAAPFPDFKVLTVKAAAKVAAGRDARHADRREIRPDAMFDSPIALPGWPPGRIAGSRPLRFEFSQISARSSPNGRSTIASVPLFYHPTTPRVEG